MCEGSVSTGSTHLVDLLHSSGAVDEFLYLMFVNQMIGNDEREEGDRLPRTRRHLQHAMTLRRDCSSGVPRVILHLCVQSSFKLKHVRILLWVDVFVWEYHRQAVYRQPAYTDRP